MPMTPNEEATFIQLWQAGTEKAEIGRTLGIPRGTVSSRAYTLVRQGKIQPRPKGGAYPRRKARARALTAGTPAAHPSVPEAAVARHTEAHPSTPMQRSTPAHPSVPDELAARFMALLPKLETLVTRERDRQRLVSTPLGTPQHTVKKTYVVETLYVDLIERYARDEGLELKDVVSLAFQEFFARRRYLPEESP